MSFEYNNLTAEQEEDLFARVQMGMQLTLAEKMRASTGPWQELARLFVEDFPTVYSLMKDRARSKDFQLTLSCFSQIVECMHPTAANGVPTLKTNFTHLPKLLGNRSAADDGIKSHLASVWNTLKDLIEIDPDTFTNGDKYLRGVQTFAPVEMVAVTVLISMHSETRNNRLLIGDIQAMRTAVRENFVDLRLNATVWKWFWEYIDELEAIRGAINGSTMDRTTGQRTKRKEKPPSDNAMPGATAAAISAAAAAPKKGRFSARTKRPAAAPEEESLAVVKEEPVTITMPGPPSPKRQRTGDGQLSGSHMSSEPWRASLSSTSASVSGPHGEGNDHDTSLHAMPTHTSAQSARTIARRARQAASSTPFTLTGTAPLTASTTSSGSIAQQFTHPLTPSEVRQQRVSALNAFQHTHGSMHHSRSNLLPTLHGQNLAQSQAPVAPMVSAANPSAPHRSHAPRKDVLEVAASVTQGAQSSPGPPHPRSMQSPKAVRSRPTQQEIDGSIDLTSDTEQERQDLLSSFKTKPSPSSRLN